MANFSKKILILTLALEPSMDIFKRKNAIAGGDRETVTIGKILLNLADGDPTI